MSPDEAWATLGIAPTPEARAIRQAYAAKLRALDVDAERDTFAELRTARDLALQLADSGQIVPSEPAIETSASHPELRMPGGILLAPLFPIADADRAVATRPPDPNPIFLQTDPAIRPADAPAVPPLIAPVASLHPPRLDVVTVGAVTLGADTNRFDTHYRAIHNLLLPPDVEDPGPLSHDEVFVVAAHIDAVLQDPRLEEIAFYADAANWFANTLARAAPRSDPLLRRVIDYFGWMAGVDGIRQDPAVAFVCNRLRALEADDTRPAFYTRQPIVPSGVRPVDGPAPSPDLSLRPPVLDAPVSNTLTTRPATDEYEAHYRAIHDLLFPLGNPDPGLLGQHELTALRGHIETVLRDPKLEELGAHADAARWFAHHLARACPRSDPLLPVVIEYFGWMQDAGKVGEDAAIAFVTRRQRTLEFLAAVQNRKHPLNGAWRELTRPANESSTRGLGVSKLRVRRLLETIRRDYPDLESALDWYRVDLWEGRASGGNRVPGGCFGFGFGIYILVLVLGGLLGGIKDNGTSNTLDPVPMISVPSVTLSAEVADIDYAVDSIYGSALDASRISSANPALDRDLRALWKKAFDSGEQRPAFRQKVFELQSEHVRRGIRKADYDLIAAYRQNELDEARALRAIGPRRCADFFTGDANYQQIPTGLREEDRTLRARILLETDTSGRPLPDKGTFSIPDAIYRDVARRAGLSIGDMDRAFRFEGPSEEQCKARIALIEAALAAPRPAGLKLLRAM